MSKPNLKQILDALSRQVLVGKAYLEIAKGLLQSDPVIRQGSEIFWGLTINGSLQLAQITVAKLYDRTPGAIAVPAMLYHAACERATFQRGSLAEVDEAIFKAAQRVISLQPTVRIIRKRRNKWLVHLDPEAVANPVALTVKAALTFPELESALKATEATLVDLASLYEGIVFATDLRFKNDFKSALNWIRTAKCRFIEDFEKEFGAGSWRDLRPHDCSRSKFELI